MPTNKKRVLVTIEPEWEQKLDDLKRGQFYNTSYSAVIRFVMERGFRAIERVHEQIKKEGK